MTNKIRQITLLLAVAMGATVFCSSAPPKTPVYLDDSRPLEERIEDALSRMTLEEKVKILHAQSKFSSAGVRSLGIPELWCTDGPHGIRPEVLWDEWRQAGWTSDSCMAFPALTCLAATWNEDIAYLFGKSIGEEARYREKDILLGPGVNIYRTPLNGRNFEYMGEDPYLSSVMVVPYVRGVQENGVAACVKHYALNNQESHRKEYEAVIDDRTLHEIYLPPYKAAVQKGGVWTVMGSFNKYKGEFCCHNRYLLNDILKRDWGFDGAVISDWGGVKDTDLAINNGVDLEFGTGTDGMTTKWANYDSYHLAGPYLEKLNAGEASEEVLDDKVRRVLRTIFRTSMNRNKPFGSLCSPEHDDAARRIASEGIVLLKNEDDVLPVNLDNVKRIAVIGENALKKMTVGGGSSSLKVRYEITPIDGIRTYVGDKAEVVYERGYVGDVNGWLDGVSTGQDLNDSRSEDELIANAVEAASKADVVIFIGGLNKAHHNDSEGSDRLGLELPYAQDRLIEALAAVNPSLAVVLVSGNAVAMPWVEKVGSIVQAWYLGSQSGTALADVLFGAVNPSGKLPFTFPVRLEDNGAHATGSYDPSSLEAVYGEGIYVGYRWAEKKAVKPLFAFGHGLSYTTFDYSEPEVSAEDVNVPQIMASLPDSQVNCANPSIRPLRVSVRVTNTGKVAGKEVVQFYVGTETDGVDRPVKELKAFRKISLEPGESQIVAVEINPDLLRRYDEEAAGWVLDGGVYDIYVGSSSEDIRCRTSFNIRMTDVDEDIVNTRRFISASWDRTVRNNTEDCPPRLGLPYPYTVPSVCGAFQEMYYWDTFFTNEGLLLDGRTELAKDNVENMLYLVERYGKMLNGSATWFLNRSQPPFLSLMVRSVYESTGDKEWLSEVLPTLEKEYSFWMENRMTPCGLNRYGNEASDAEKMEFIGLLKSRLGDSFNTDGLSRDELLEIGSHYIAEAESGWDFTPRFDGHCEDYCPVDLNSLLYAYETNFSWFRKELGQKHKVWDRAAEKRRKLMRRKMCDNTTGLYYDYDYVSGKLSEVSSAAVFSLLFCGVVDTVEAERIVNLTLDGASSVTSLECTSGISACAEGDYKFLYQWSYPNGWAPLTYVAVKGLDRYGFDIHAVRLAEKYVDMVAENFAVTGNLWEKYNVTDGSIDVNGEYEMPTMMGWTAGTFCSMCNFLGKTF